MVEEMSKELLVQAVAKENAQKMVALSQKPPRTLNEIDASNIGTSGLYKVRVLGQQERGAVAKFYRTRCKACGAEESVELTPVQAAFFSKLKDRCASLKDDGKECGGTLEITEKTMQNSVTIFVAETLDNLMQFTTESSRPFKVYVIGPRVPPGKMLSMVAKVAIEPKSNNLVLVASEVIPLESEASSFKLYETDKTDFPQYFSNGIDLKPQVAPDMVGREIVQEALLLVLHSPPEVPDLNGRNIRGCLRATWFGDTKCYKSESIKDAVTGLGDYCVAEQASRAGITYSIDTDAKTILWGTLPLNDGGVVGLDGLQKFDSDQMGEFREALEQQKVIVRRSVSGEAPARTRVIAAMNPNKSMDAYIFACMALLDSTVFSSAPDVTRWDLFLPFSDGDVAKDLIAARSPKTRPVPPETFRRHVHWVWSRKPFQIVYEDAAKNAIVEDSKELLSDYSFALLPIVHNGCRDVLTRFAVAYAALQHSTDSSHEKVIVKQEHVEKARGFYERMLGTLQLKDYKLAEEGKLEITDTAFKEIVAALNDDDYKILEAIKTKGATADALAVVLECSARTVKEHYAKLKGYGLIVTTPKKGAELAPRGVKFLRLFRSKQLPKEEEKPEERGDYREVDPAFKKYSE